MHKNGLPDVSMVEGFLSTEEAHGLFDYARKAGPGVLEVGVYYGKSTIALAAGRKISSNTPVYAVDHGRGSVEHQKLIPPEGTWPTALGNFERLGVLGNIVPIMMDSLRARLVLDSFYWSFVFVDGSHDRLSVLTDAILWIPRIYPGGLIAFHDYSPSGQVNVVPAVDAVRSLMQLEQVDQVGSIGIFKVRPELWV